MQQANEVISRSRRVAGLMNCHTSCHCHCHSHSQSHCHTQTATTTAVAFPRHSVRTAAAGCGCCCRRCRHSRCPMSAGIMHISIRECWPVGVVHHHLCRQLMIYISEAELQQLNLHYYWERLNGSLDSLPAAFTCCIIITSCR